MGLQPQKPVSRLLQQTAHFSFVVMYKGNNLEQKAQNTAYNANIRQSDNLSPFQEISRRCCDPPPFRSCGISGDRPRPVSLWTTEDLHGLIILYMSNFVNPDENLLTFCVSSSIINACQKGVMI